MSPVFRFRTAPLSAALVFSLTTLTASAQSPIVPAAPGAPVMPTPATSNQPATRLDTTLSRTPANSRIIPVDRIVAVVNDDVITQNDLNERLAVVIANLQKQGTPLPPQETLTKQLLERMINDMVQMQLAKETGIKIDDQTLDRTIAAIAQENNLQLPAFRELLEKDGVRWPRFREDIRQEIMTNKLRERDVESSVVVTESEVDNQLALEAREQTTDTEFRLAHILVLVPEQANAAQIEARRKRALQALGELRKGADFAQISATYSDAPDALQGGNLGWRSAARLPSIFSEAIGNLGVGEISDILKSPNGFHIVKLLEKRGKNAQSGVIQTRARHILLRTKDTLTDDEAKERLSRLRERITSGADFAELAKVHSEDSSAQKGGDLGWLSPGDTVPEFERTLNGLRDGEVSRPIQTQFGWHLVQVQERRNEAMSDDRRRAMARQTLRQRKSDEAFQDWLRQQRDRAFVEMRLEDRG
ncbi:MAG: peptidylprolyl isomerase [Betaproteobacteria bacterium]|nr:peptidylprolyl isomerase [Betaproteobacteria bacterium]